MPSDRTTDRTFDYFGLKFGEVPTAAALVAGWSIGRGHGEGLKWRDFTNNNHVFCRPRDLEYRWLKK